MGHPFSSNGKGQGFLFLDRQGSFSGLSQHHHHHHIRSAPSGVPLERHFGFFPEFSDTSFMSPAAFGGIGVSHNDGGFMVNMGSCSDMSSGISIPHNVSENGSSSMRMMSSPRLSPVCLGNGPYPGLLPNSMEELTERGRSRQVENNGNQLDNKMQFQLDLDKIINIPQRCCWLPLMKITGGPMIFSNCPLILRISAMWAMPLSVCYLLHTLFRFMRRASLLLKLRMFSGFIYVNNLMQAFNGKKWEKFNSEKVASLAFARIQGKGALVAHFQNSSLMNEDKRCRPILFHSGDGGHQSILEHLHSSLNIIRQPNGSHLGDSSGSPKEKDASDKPETS
ncbi:hypothetical protein CRYUN_Cryun34aG0043400 [Craigia yunnanensis]